MSRHLFIALVALEACAGVLGVRSEEDDTKTVLGHGHLQNDFQKHFEKSVDRSAKKTLNDVGQDESASLDVKIKEGDIVYAQRGYNNEPLEVQVVLRSSRGQKITNEELNMAGTTTLQPGAEGKVIEPTGIYNGKGSFYWRVEFDMIDCLVVDWLQVRGQPPPPLQERPSNRPGKWQPWQPWRRQANRHHREQNRPSHRPGKWQIWLVPPKGRKKELYDWDDVAHLPFVLPHPEEITFPWDKMIEYTVPGRGKYFVTFTRQRDRRSGKIVFRGTQVSAKGVKHTIYWNYLRRS